MSKQFSEGELLKSLDRLENVINKGQIVNTHVKKVGRNSERRDWAGSTWEDEDTPNNAKDGTNYTPEKGLAKNINEMSEGEIQQYLQARKSGLPNAVKARQEILKSVPGAREAMCNQCEGAGRQNDVRKSMCQGCGGHGTVLIAPTPEAQEMMKGIAARYNVSREAYERVRKGGAGHKGGGSGESDTTPSDLTADEPEKFDENGQAAFKGGEDEYEDEMNMGKGEDDEDDEDDFGGDEEEFEMGKALTQVLGAIVKSQKLILARQADLYRMVKATGQVQVGIAKSLIDGAPADAGQPRAGRAPRALGPGLQIEPLNKGWVDQAPGDESQGYANGGTYQPKYDWQTLKKSAGNMAMAGQLDPHDVLRMDAGVDVPNNLVQKVEHWIDQNGGNRAQ